MSSKLTIKAGGTLFRQGIETEFVFTAEGYHGTITVARGLNLDAILDYLAGNTDGEADLDKMTDDSTTLRMAGWTTVDKEGNKTKTSLIGGNISNLELTYMTHYDPSKPDERDDPDDPKSANKRDSSVFALTFPKYVMDGIPGVNIPNFFKAEFSLELFRASRPMTIIPENGDKPIQIAKDFAALIGIKIGDFLDIKFALPTVMKSEATIDMRFLSRDADAKKPKKPEEEGISWFDIDKKLGPFKLRRVGYEFKKVTRKTQIFEEYKDKKKTGKYIDEDKKIVKVDDKKNIIKEGKKEFFDVEGNQIDIYLDIDFILEKFLVVAKGLRVGINPAKPFKMPEFGISGLGIALVTDSFTLAGFLAKLPDQGDIKNQFVGALIIKAGKITIVGIAAYAEIKEKTSIFAYAYVGWGGEGSPFTVTGIALGFGYNRDAFLPSVDKMTTFPLISPILPGGEPLDTENIADFFDALITDLTVAFPPKDGALFFCIGISFNAFVIVNGFALLCVTIGDRVSIDILALANIVLPEADNVLAFIEIAVKVSFVPSEGTLKIDGLITKRSFILHKSVKLRGGFAFYTWMKELEDKESGNLIKAGDFVLTLGGYHKRYNVPAHYPKVDRVSLSWEIEDILTLKAEVYFALTSAAIMVGGAFTAVFEAGPLKASFLLSLDLLLQWIPFYYDAELKIGIHISVTVKVFGVRKTASFDLRVELHIWGPDFSGHAEIEIKVCGIGFSFGLDFGAANDGPPPVTWLEFAQSFLPPPKQALNCSVGAGVIRKEKIGKGDEEEEVYYVNGKEVVLYFEAQVPVKTLTIGQKERKGSDFGAYPTLYRDMISEMNIICLELAANELEKIFDISLKKVYKPAGLWSNKKRGSVDINDEDNLVELSNGAVFKVKPPDKGDTFLKVNPNHLSFNVTSEEVPNDKLNLSTQFDYNNLMNTIGNEVSSDILEDLTLNAQGELQIPDDIATQLYQGDVATMTDHIDIYREEFLRAKPHAVIYPKGTNWKEEPGMSK